MNRRNGSPPWRVAVDGGWAYGSARPWLVAVVALLAGTGVAGPVAGFVCAVYTAAGVVLVRRAQLARRFARERVAAVDAVSILAAELRAGRPAPQAFATVPVGDGPGAGAVAARLTSAVELAESSGAPLADVLDRLDIHLRAMDRARRTAHAQAAGARASAALLAVLPVAGAGLGYLVGVDPVHTLFHTPVGAACAVVAVLLQLAGVAWSERISQVEVPA
jgi:tight adherence protein B